MDMVRLRLDISYCGTNFHGWARQGDSDLRTVQGTLEDALTLMLRVPVRLSVAGRTDAGVHASGQVAHCDIPRAALDTRSIDGDPGRLVRRLAKYLDPDVRVRACTFAPEGFDARFSALRRHYRYRLTTAGHGALPTRALDTAVWPHPIDIQRAQAIAHALVGLHDFAAFCKPRPHATTIRQLQRFEWQDVSTALEPEVYEVHVVADAFCWNMVRALVGACLVASKKQLDTAFAAELLTQKQRSPQVPLAPACGLDLVQVDYPAPEELAARALNTRARRQPSTE